MTASTILTGNTLTPFNIEREELESRRAIKGEELASQSEPDSWDGCLMVVAEKAPASFEYFDWTDCC